MASHRQMLRILLPSASRLHLARTHLFLNPKAGLRRNRFWRHIMESDVLVYDFQDGCPPGERLNVFTGLRIVNRVFPNKCMSVRLTDLENDKGHTIYDEMKV